MLLYNYSFRKFNDNIFIHGTGCCQRISDAYNFACTLPSNEKAIIYHSCSFIHDRHQENLVMTYLLRNLFPEYKMYVIGCDNYFHRVYYDDFAKTYSNSEVSQIISSKPILSRGIPYKGMFSIKIQDGCHYRCAYCAINKYFDGEPSSLSYEKIVQLIKEHADQPKIHLGGTEIASYYDKEINMNLIDLAKQLVIDFPHIKILFSAIDPAVKEAEELIKLIGSDKKHFVQYVLIGAQSGSDIILRAMRRRHNVERIKYLHKIAQQLGITVGWDMIVGFPGETEELFMETLNLVKELKPVTYNVFEYSDIKGTESYKMNNKVPKAEIERRSQLALHLTINLQDKNFLDYHDKCSVDFLEDKDKTAVDDGKILYRKRAFQCICDGQEYYADISNIEELKNLLNLPKNTLVHVSIDEPNLFEKGAVAYFLMNFLENPIVVHAPKNSKHIEEIKNIFNIVIGD